jgi:plasmid stability protein
MLVIRDLDARTLAELRKAAARNGRGLDAEIASILALHVGTDRSKSRSTVDFEGQTSGRVTPMKSGLRMLLDIKAD